jgi:ribosomal protein S18 acetylase RimI-like enzyme
VKFLIDTNVLIPLEPTGPEHMERMMEPALALLRAIEESGDQLFIHPATTADLGRDLNHERRRLRELLLQKYLPLPHPPPIPESWRESLRSPPHGSNDWVDHQLLAALHANAVSILVTEDRGIHRKAERVGLKHRVATIGDALALILGLNARFVQPPPAVQFTHAHDVDIEDPFFDSLRGDYPGFDSWFRRCQEAHRRCWVVRAEGHRLAALCLIKDEDEKDAFGLRRKILKICTFKVDPAHQGRRLGELLLKSVFAHTATNQYDYVYLTAFEKQGALLTLLDDFGFFEQARSESGEFVLAKRLRPTDEYEQLSPLDFHIRFGPPAARLVAPAFFIPIEPRFHHLLFPDADEQLGLQAGANPFGNGLRKAYLCRASIRQIAPGAPLLFYRSQSNRGVTVVGIAEKTLASRNAEEIAATVGKRTVYSMRDIEDLCSRGEVLAILFRQAQVVQSGPISMAELRQHGALRAAPQSITTIPESAHPWLRHRLGLGR